ncbi:MAG: hypothetical protein E7H38_07800 [Varibaculum cambriense]|uniref:hypothetical protein n=1 Tax=Varibaculum cambriense TaxID=184870 RepID=UPI0029121688|nr:hypothetical protein [Varibaculum cambriense]MDU4028257.1 hypothetical protein [Varibaculum cambriense]
MSENLDPCASCASCEGCEESAELLEPSPLPVDDEENAADLPQDPDSVANLDQEEAE